jgi:predicted NUDIX family NTP pyrophosphohydrolase
MPSKKSAGLLLYRASSSGTVEVLLVHPGGPFWAKKDQGAWSIPKGEFEDSENPFAAARREFAEETALAVPDGPALPLDPVRQPGGKLVYAWAIRGDVDVSHLSSNRFSLEWPPKSKRYQDFPEIDRAAWFTLQEARGKILPGQIAFLAQLEQFLGSIDHDRPRSDL